MHTAATFIAINKQLTNTKFTLQRSTMFLLFKDYSLAEAIYLLIKFHKTKSFLWNTNNTKRNDVNEQNTHTHSERKKFRKG